MMEKILGRKRIMIIGCCGSGKSTLAKKMHNITGLELIHLDQHYWKPNWVETPNKQWKKKVEMLANKESWIIDGNYGGTMDIRMEKADTVIYLKYSTIKCLYRVVKRIVKYHGHSRPDMPKGCNERFDFDFLHYVAVYNIIHNKKINALLEKVRKDKLVFILKNDNEVYDFVKKMSAAHSIQPL